MSPFFKRFHRCRLHLLTTTPSPPPSLRSVLPTSIKTSSPKSRPPHRVPKSISTRPQPQKSTISRPFLRARKSSKSVKLSTKIFVAKALVLLSNENYRTIVIFLHHLLKIPVDTSLSIFLPSSSRKVKSYLARLNLETFL